MFVTTALHVPLSRKHGLAIPWNRRPFPKLPVTLLTGSPQHRSCTGGWEQICKPKEFPMENTRVICKAPHSRVFALPRPGIPWPFPVPRPGKPVPHTKSISALHFLVASASPNGFCKVFPVDLADSLCWHVAKSVQNITICWPQPGPSFVFVWP